MNITQIIVAHRTESISGARRVIALVNGKLHEAKLKERSPNPEPVV